MSSPFSQAYMDKSPFAELNAKQEAMLPIELKNNKFLSFLMKKSLSIHTSNQLIILLTMKRLFDILFSIILLVILLIPTSINTTNIAELFTLKPISV